jgi:hypothetical protein
METKLSFDINDPKQFSLMDIHDFHEDGYGVYFLFSQGDFIFWVITENEIVISVMEIDRTDLDNFELDKPVTDEEYAVHVNDGAILNTPKYIGELQDKINLYKWCKSWSEYLTIKQTICQ